MILHYPFIAFLHLCGAPWRIIGEIGIDLVTASWLKEDGAKAVAKAGEAGQESRNSKIDHVENYRQGFPTAFEEDKIDDVQRNDDEALEGCIIRIADSWTEAESLTYHKCSSLPHKIDFRFSVSEFILVSIYG